MAEQSSDHHEGIWFPPGESPLGFWGGLNALIDLSADAPLPPGGQRRWYVSDHEALASAMYLEARVKSDGLPTGAPPDVRAELNLYLDAWHTALPFSEAERGVVFDAYRLCKSSIREVPSQMRNQEFEAMSAGFRT